MKTYSNYCMGFSVSPMAAQPDSRWFLLQNPKAGLNRTMQCSRLPQVDCQWMVGGKWCTIILLLLHNTNAFFWLHSSQYAYTTPSPNPVPVSFFISMFLRLFPSSHTFSFLYRLWKFYFDVEIFWVELTLRAFCWFFFASFSFLFRKMLSNKMLK